MITPYARVNMVSEDGLVEGIEIPEKKFAMGVKWHPEIMREDEAVRRLFAEFMRAVRECVQGV